MIFINISKYFPFTHTTFVLTLYGQFENWLKTLRRMTAVKDFQSEVKDLAGNNYIEKTRRYLEIVAELI